jgi:hypothetical protein
MEKVLVKGPDAVLGTHRLRPAVTRLRPSHRSWAERRERSGRAAVRVGYAAIRLVTRGLRAL